MNSAGPARRRGLCLVLAAPSGAGKSTLARALIAQEPELTLSVSVTTRAPRAGEQEGVHYFFRTEDEFAALRDRGDLLEHAGVFGRHYGTPRAPVVAALEAGRDVLFDIDWQGHRSLQAALPGDVVGVYVLPPDMAALRARLASRGDAPAAIDARMAEAAAELSHWPEFAYAVVNDDFATALATVRAILHAGRAATSRLGGVFAGYPRVGDNSP